MKKAQTLSIVIPVYNEESYLKQCLDAVAKQTIKPDEVIIVDNNSTDSSVEIAKRYNFVKVIHEKKQSVLYARNKGFDAAKSDIIGRIDADTVLPKDWVKIAKQVFADQSVVATSGPTAWYDLPWHPANRFVVDIVVSILLAVDKKYPLLYGSNMAFRKSAWDEIKNELCENRSLHEDIDLGVHLFQKGYPVQYSRALYASISTRRADDTFADFQTYNRDRRETFRAHGLNPFGDKIAQALFISGWVLCWPLRQSYDEKTRTRSLKQLFSRRNVSRKHPMH